MSQFCFRILSERYLTSEIDFVRWNSKYDLLAIATKRGDVILQRLFWKKAWQLPPPSFTPSSSHDSCISELCWSPSGKHLAIFFSDGRIIFVEVENGKVTYDISDEFRSDGHEKWRPVVISKWVEAQESKENGSATLPVPSITFDDGNDLLIPLPPGEKSGHFDGSLESEPVSLGVNSITNGLSLLIFNDISPRLRFLLNGLFRVADLDLSNLVSDTSTTSDGKEFIPLAFEVSADFHKLAVAFTGGLELRFSLFETPFAKYSSKSLARISKRVAHVSSSLRYIESVAQKILDTGDDSLNELDTKLTKYALSRNGNVDTIGDDFLQMLTFGIASPELEHFVTHSLSDKGMRKLSSSIENLYQNYFHLLAVDLDSGVSSLYHHLTALQNLVPSSDTDCSLWTETIEKVEGRLSLGITRTLDTIGCEAKSISLFVRWLHRCVLAISDENVSPSFAHFSYDEVDAVAEFIQENLCKAVSEDDTPFGNTPTALFGLSKTIASLKKDGTNGNGEGRMEGTGTEHTEEQLSLWNDVQDTVVSVKKILERVSAVFSQHFILVSSSCCACAYEEAPKNVLISFDADQHRFRVVFSTRRDSDDDVFVIEFDARTATMVASFRLSSAMDVCRNVINVDFYNTDTVTALMKERTDDENEWNYFLYQIDAADLRTVLPAGISTNLSTVKCRHETAIDVPWNVVKRQPLTDGQFCLVSVSGSRKVGCVVFACRSRLKLLEMEPEDDTMAHSSVSEENTAPMDTEGD